MEHSSPSVAARYYIHVADAHQVSRLVRACVSPVYNFRHIINRLLYSLLDSKNVTLYGKVTFRPEDDGHSMRWSARCSSA